MEHVYDPKLQSLFLGDDVVARSNRLFLKIYYTEDGATIPLITVDPESLVVYDEQGNILLEKDTYREIRRMLRKCKNVLFRCTSGRWWESTGFDEAVKIIASELDIDEAALYPLLKKYKDTVLAFISTVADYYDFALRPESEEFMSKDAYFDIRVVSRQYWFKLLNMLAATDRRLLGHVLRANVPLEQPVISKTFYV